MLRRVAGMQLEHASIDDVRADDSRPAGAVSVDDITSSMPTQGHEIKACRLFDTNVVAYDVGGARHLRHSWRKYYTTSAASAGVDAVVFVIDASDRRRTAEAGLALRQVHPGWAFRPRHSHPAVVVANIPPPLGAHVAAVGRRSPVRRASAGVGQQARCAHGPHPRAAGAYVEPLPLFFRPLVRVGLMPFEMPRVLLG